VQLANAIAVIALTPVITPWVSKKIESGPRLDILAVAALWTTVSMGAAALAHTTAGFCAAGALLAPGEVAWFVVAAGIVHRIAPPAYRGRYHGIWSVAMAVAAVLSPILASASLIHGGQSLAAATTMAVGAIGAVLCIPLARSLAGSAGSAGLACA
jgi:sugar phosphate permease